MAQYGDTDDDLEAMNEARFAYESESDSDLDEGPSPSEATAHAVSWFGKMAPRETTHRTGLAYDERMRNHRHPYQKHPECPERVETIMAALNETGLARRMYRLPVRPVTDSELRLVHTSEHLMFVNSLIDESTRKNQFHHLEHKSAFASEGSVEAAYVSCGCVMSALENLASGVIRNAVCVVRPPGHHAEKQVVCGFCLFDNVAVAAAAAIEKYKFERVLILDWDVHHGNGIQHAFEENKNVLYISIHRWDQGRFYPGGLEAGPTKVGIGSGEGYNINIGWNGRGPFGDEEYYAAFDSVVMPAARAFDPDLVFVSAGFDAAIGDPLGGCEVSPNAYGQMLHMLSSLASGRVIVALEGGYNLASISASMLCCASVLLGDAMPLKKKERKPSDDGRRAIVHTLEAHSKLDNPFSKSWIPASPLTVQKEFAAVAGAVTGNGFDSEEEEEEDVDPFSVPERKPNSSAVVQQSETLQRSPRSHHHQGNHHHHIAPHILEDARFVTNVVEPSSYYIRNNIQTPPSIEDGRPQCDAPCDECSRIEDVSATNLHNIGLRNWVCLKCYNVYCCSEKQHGSETVIQGHAREHAEKTQHHIALCLQNFMMYDFELKRYLSAVTHPDLRPILNIFHNDKFQQSIPEPQATRQ